MPHLRPIASTDPLLQSSRLFVALQRSLDYLDAHGEIGLTKAGAFNRRFVTWAAEHYDWPAYAKDRLLQIQKVLNEEDVLSVLAIHDLLLIMKLGRHHKGTLRLTKRGKALRADPGQLFDLLAETYLFRYNHARLSRFDETTPGSWDVFLNVINIEAEAGVSEAALVEIFYRLKKEPGTFAHHFAHHRGFLFTHVLRPLCWIGFLAEIQENQSPLAERIYAKTPLWCKALALRTDRDLPVRVVQ